MSRLTIIVPVYKVEKYIKNCVESILSQTYKDFKCIFIDDGSTDKSGEICDEYAKKDSRIQVIHKENGGLSSARNIGMELAESELICFVDSDDTIDFTMYEKLVSYLDEYNCDAVMCDYQAHTEYDRIVPSKNEFDGKEFTQQLLNNQAESQVWKFLFKTKLWQGVRFPLHRHFEDLWTVHKVMQNAKKVVFTKEKLYFYNNSRTDSVSTDKENLTKNHIDIALSFWDRFEYCIENSFSSEIVLENALKFSIIVFADKNSKDAKYQFDTDKIRNYLKKYIKQIIKYSDIKRILLCILTLISPCALRLLIKKD